MDSVHWHPLLIDFQLWQPSCILTRQSKKQAEVSSLYRGITWLGGPQRHLLISANSDHIVLERPQVKHHQQSLTRWTLSSFILSHAVVHFTFFTSAWTEMEAAHILQSKFYSNTWISQNRRRDPSRLCRFSVLSDTNGRSYQGAISNCRQTRVRNYLNYMACTGYEVGFPLKLWLPDPICLCV